MSLANVRLSSVYSHCQAQDGSWCEYTLSATSQIDILIIAAQVADIEGTTHGHDVIPVKSAIKYLASRGYPDEMAANILNNIKPNAVPYLYVGSSRENGANRVVFGEAVNLVLDKLSKEEAAKKVMVIDSA